ncbi:MAG: DUF1559 domain-containing protein [Armatimonadetes bacterium]|nr:DUF1559 domain-containing protein [Armatimonadota bacterium]
MRARDEHAGQAARCPACGRELVVPGGEGVQATAPPVRDQLSEGVQTGSNRAGPPVVNGRPRPSASGRGPGAASIILGVLSLVFYVPFPQYSVILGMLAVVLAFMGLWAAYRGRAKDTGLAVAGLVTGALGALLPLLLFLARPAEGSSTKLQSANNLKQIALAMQNHHDVMGMFPPAAVCDPAGKPLLSWRVAILPFIEQQFLYSEFKLDEPWDGPNNSKLLSRMPEIYALPGDTTAPPGYTYYRVFVGKGAAFELAPGNGHTTPGLNLTQFTDDPTILVVEAATAVPWTKPDELAFDPNGPLPPLGGHYRGGFFVAMADGELRFIPQTVSQATLRALITRNAGDIPGRDW